MRILASLAVLSGIFASTLAQAQQSNNGQSPPQKYLMAALGDSITAGFLADTTLAWFNSGLTSSYYEPPKTFYSSVLDLSKYIPPFTAIEALETRYELSWSTGKWISSHYELLNQYLQSHAPGSTLTAINLAKTGGLTSDVVAQANQLASMMSSGQYTNLKYVTLLIGNNDACTGVDDGVMAQNLAQIYKILSQIKQSEPIHILVVAMPNIPELGKPEIVSAKTILDISCSEMRNGLTNTCVTLTNWNTSSEYESLVNYMSDKNQVLQTAATQAAQNYPNLQVSFSMSLFNKNLETADLAVDCFHPNAGAQQWASQTLWNDQPWFH